MSQNLHVCMICCRLEVVYDVISGQNVKNIEGYPVVNFEIASFDSFRDIKKNHFVTVAAADIDDSIKQKSLRVSLNLRDNSKNCPRNLSQTTYLRGTAGRKSS